MGILSAIGSALVGTLLGSGGGKGGGSTPPEPQPKSLKGYFVRDKRREPLSKNYRNAKVFSPTYNFETKTLAAINEIENQDTIKERKYKTRILRAIG